jgi:hypothetical protein
MKNITSTICVYGSLVIAILICILIVFIGAFRLVHYIYIYFWGETHISYWVENEKPNLTTPLLNEKQNLHGGNYSGLVSEATHLEWENNVQSDETCHEWNDV